MSQIAPDFAYYGASAISHEGVHLLGGGEYPAYQRQDAVLHGFKSFFQSSDLYKTLDDSVEEGIKASAPQR